MPIITEPNRHSKRKHEGWVKMPNRPPFWNFFTIHELCDLIGTSYKNRFRSAVVMMAIEYKKKANKKLKKVI